MKGWIEMMLTPMAHFLNTSLNGFDNYILTLIHGFAVSTNFLLTPVITIITTSCDYGIGMIILGIVLALFKRTRKIGICVLLSLIIGSLITNVIVKNWVARPRPYQSDTALYNTWWQMVGARTESGFSFPSGHTTAAMAAMTAIFLTSTKKYRWISFIFVLLIGFSRNYLMVHYPSDVIGGIISGGIAAFVAAKLIDLAYAKKQCSK